MSTVAPPSGPSPDEVPVSLGIEGTFYVSVIRDDAGRKFLFIRHPTVELYYITDEIRARVFETLLLRSYPKFQD